MANYRVIVRYNIKAGKRDEALRFLNTSMFIKAKEYGFSKLELLEDKANPNMCIATGIWSSLADAKKFQEYWDMVKMEISNLFEETPIRELYMSTSIY